MTKTKTKKSAPKAHEKYNVYEIDGGMRVVDIETGKSRPAIAYTLAERVDIVTACAVSEMHEVRYWWPPQRFDGVDGEWDDRECQFCGGVMIVGLDETGAPDWDSYRNRAYDPCKGIELDWFDRVTAAGIKHYAVVLLGDSTLEHDLLSRLWDDGVCVVGAFAEDVASDEEELREFIRLRPVDMVLDETGQRLPEREVQLGVTGPQPAAQVGT